MANRVTFESLIDLNALVLNTYVYVGSFAHPSRILKIGNATNTGLLIGFGAVGSVSAATVPTNDYVAADSFLLYDFDSNRANSEGNFVLPADTGIWVAALSAGPYTGFVYITSIYAV